MFPLVSNNIITEIEVILLGCDESIKGINPLNGYQIKDIKIEEFSHKNDLIDGNGQFLISFVRKGINFINLLVFHQI